MAENYEYLKYTVPQTNNRLANDACKVYHSAAQSIPTSAWTILSWDTEEIDNNAMHSATTNNHLITVQTTGLYLISALLKFATNATGRRGLYISNYVSGVTGVMLDARVAAVSGETTSISASCLKQLTAGDLIWMSAYQDSGSALNTYNGVEHSFLSLVKVG